MRLQRLPRRGSAAIEFALWLPVLLAFLAAVVDWGHHWNRRVAVARGVMEGVRSASAVFEGPTVLPPGSRVEQRARDRTEQVLQDLGIQCPGPRCTMTVRFCPIGTTCIGGGPATLFNAIEVRVEYQYEPLIGLIPVPANITEQFMMGVEYQRPDVP